MADERWDESSFLVELKPRADFANVFVACPEGKTREVVKLLIDEIEAGSATDTHRDVLDNQYKRHAKLPFVKLMPNTISSLAWADNDTLFTCRVRPHSTDFALEPMGFKHLARDIRGETNVDDFVKLMRTCERVEANCSHCGEPILQQRQGFNLRYQTLPTEDWFECGSGDTMNYFCCAHGGGQSGADSQANQSTPNPPSQYDCFVTESCFILPAAFATNCSVNTSNAVQCDQCLSEIGNVTRAGADADFVCYKIFHTAVNLTYSNADAAEPQLNFICSRFTCEESFYAWFLLSRSESNSALKFFIRNLDGSPKILIWLLDSYSVMIRGHLVQPNSVDQSKPLSYPAIKLLYKIYDQDSSASDPRANGVDFSICNLNLPYSSCLQLTKILLDSTGALPNACRKVGLFHVGCLKMSRTVTT